MLTDYVHRNNYNILHHIIFFAVAIFKSTHTNDIPTLPSNQLKISLGPALCFIIIVLLANH